MMGPLGLTRSNWMCGQDKPTLHLGKHHLLHGKIVNLPRPLAVIRRADSRDASTSKSSTHTKQPDGSGPREDEDAPELELETQPGPSAKRSRPNPGRRPTTTTTTTTTTTISSNPIDPFQTLLRSPSRTTTTLPAPASSSPPGPSTKGKNRDYSSDLSSPVQPFIGRASKRKTGRMGDGLGTVLEREPVEPGEVDVDAIAAVDTAMDGQVDRAGRTDKDEESGTGDRTREYKVVGVVRKKVVFALR